MKQLALVAAGYGLLATAAFAQAPAAPDWLSGYWISCEGGRQASETWTGSGSGTLLGQGLTRRADGRVNFEMMRIAPGSAGGLSFYAMPDGAPVTEFRMIAHDARRVVFENPAHDFPQRVIYERRGRTLHARIEGVMDGAAQGMDWRYRRARFDSRCPGFD
ncbi:MAG: DUF6265 family protein [Hyphomonadaceae bacterium]